MILNHAPLKGALFGSVVGIRECLDPLSRAGFPEIVAFYRDEGILFFSPSFRKIWPEIELDGTLDQFLSSVNTKVVPAEKELFSRFGKSLITGDEDRAGIFLLRASSLPECSVLGVASFGFSWGNLVVAIPGTEADPVRTALSTLERRRFQTAFEAADLWVRDAEKEYVLSWILEHFPEEFRNEGQFERTIAIRDPEGRRRTLSIYYHYRGGKWQRDVHESRSVQEKPSGISPEEDGQRLEIDSPVVRGKGTRHGNEILLHFTAFLGRVLPLGDLSLPAPILSKEGMKTINHFLRKVSRETLLRARSLKSDAFRFTRFWNGEAFRLEGLEEISRLVAPKEWKNLMVLPFWTTPSGPLTEVLKASRVSDPLFADPHRNMGAVLLRDCSEGNAQRIVYENFRTWTKAHIEIPMNVEGFLEGA